MINIEVRSPLDIISELKTKKDARHVLASFFYITLHLILMQFIFIIHYNEALIC